MIDVRNVSKIYENGDTKTVALNHVTFKIDQGDFVAIMGPSGSGKSTLMHILGCLDAPTDGSYFLDNKNVSKLSDNELAEVRMTKIGFVFQQFNLLPRVTALRNVMLPLVYAEKDRSERITKAAQALRASGLDEDRWDHYSNQLSGGQMQRVAIARALVNDPLIILADEPTGNLDTKTGEIILSTFQSLNDEHHRTIVLITHERYVAEHADRIIYLHDGEIKNDQKNSKKRIPSAFVSADLPQYP